jgi:hypothetical protein
VKWQSGKNWRNGKELKWRNGESLELATLPIPRQTKYNLYVNESRKKGRVMMVLAAIGFYFLGVWMTASWLSLIVSGLSYSFTIGHWENEQYRIPFLLSSVSTALSSGAFYLLTK